MEEIIKYLETLPKEVLTHIVYKLMVKGKLSYSDITTLHIQNMERLSKVEGESFTTVVTANAIDYATALVNRLKEESQCEK